MLLFAKSNKVFVLSRWRHPIALIRRGRLLIFALFSVPGLSLAQQAGNVTDAEATADSQLDSTYSVAISRLIESQQQAFVRAQMTWTMFSDREKALLNALQGENLISEDYAHAHSIDMVDSRTTHLKEFFVDYKINYPPQNTPPNQDYALTKIYFSCFRNMNANDQQLLIASERAWIAYRDADIDSVMVTNPNQILKNAVIVRLTMVRIAQLNSLTQAVRQASITETPPQQLPPPPAQVSSPNPDDVKAISDFQADAKQTLNALLEKNDDPFFKTADTIKNVPELPAEISAQISKLDSRYVAFSQKPSSAALLEPALNECAAVGLLASWSRFTQELKTGSTYDMDNAGSIIQRALSEKPTAITADYLPIWQSAESWQKVYENEEAKFHEHIRNAQSFADLGKTSAAIKEYQAAYELIEDSTIPEKIKHLREQSLGL